MTLQTNPPHKPKKQNEGSFEKPSGAAIGQAWSCLLYTSDAADE